jgi:hypothetical protein
MMPQLPLVVVIAAGVGVDAEGSIQEGVGISTAP